MLRNVYAPRHPHLTRGLGGQVLNESLQRHEAAGFANDTAVEANRHHLRFACLALGKQGLKGGLQVLEEGLRREAASRRVKLKIVVVIPSLE